MPKANFSLLAQLNEPQAPDLKPADFKIIELPRVFVRYARFDKKYAGAFANVLAQALKVYESHGFKMPQKVSLEA